MIILMAVLLQWLFCGLGTQLFSESWRLALPWLTPGFGSETDYDSVANEVSGWHQHPNQTGLHLSLEKS